jgi:hypothetical protein
MTCFVMFLVVNNQRGRGSNHFRKQLAKMADSSRENDLDPSQNSNSLNLERDFVTFLHKYIMIYFSSGKVRAPKRLTKLIFGLFFLVVAICISY